MDQPPHSTKNEASQVSDCGCGIPSPLNYDVIIIIKTLTDFGDHLHLFELEIITVMCFKRNWHALCKFLIFHIHTFICHLTYDNVQ